MKINGREVFKGIVKFVGSMGVGALVTIGVNQNVIPKNKYETIMLAIGKFVVSDMVSSKAETYLDDQCDKVFDLIDSFKGEPVKEIPPIKFDENGLPIEETLIEEDE